ncbi:MAG: tetratricopeptide repeat protein [Myxococcales bacterium]|nr:tetratricopeptide repeat protein [Myxococcales bacterium]
MNETHDIDAQVHALLGGDKLVAAALEPKTAQLHLAPKRGVLGDSFRAGRIAAGVILGLLAIFSTVVVSYGLRRRAAARAEQVATELSTFAATGGAEGASELLDELAANTELDPAHRAIVARAEATLYRGFNGDPAHLDRVRAALQGSPLPEHDLVVVEGLVTSCGDRLRLLPRLAALGANSDDPMVPFLMGTALARAGSAQQATAAFERALELEPSNLEFLATLAAHRVQVGEVDEAIELLDVMREVDPTSAWTLQLTALLGQPLPEVEEPHTVPVAEAWGLVYAAAAGVARNDLAAAQAKLTSAVERVHTQAAFQVDFADYLLTRGQPQAARWIVEAESWADDTPSARATRGRLLLAQGRVADAATVLGEAVDAGFADPITGLAYLEALGASGGVPDTARRFARELATAWPDRPDVAAAAGIKDETPKTGKKPKQQRRRSAKRARRR